MLTEEELMLTSKQEQFRDSPKRYTAFIGGVGSGKTYAGITKAMLCALRVRCNGAIVAPTYRMLKDTILPVLREKLEGRIIEERLSDMVWILINGSVIYLRSAEDPDHFRGLNLNWILIEEAPYCSEYIWPVAIGRLRQEVKGGDGVTYSPCAFVTGTPKGRNWVYRLFAQNGGQTNEYGMIQASSMSNPFLPKDYLESLKLNYSGKYFAQELKGEFVTFEGLVYDMFNEELHVWPREKALPKFQSYKYGADIGYTNPTAIMVFGIPTPESGKRPFDIQIDEIYKRRLTHDEIVNEILRLYKLYGRGPVYCDPSEASLIPLLRKKGIDAQAANNDVKLGIQAEQNVLSPQAGQPGAYIVKSCVHTLAEFASYTWKTRGKGNELIYLDQPEKQNDHAMDGRRYYRMSTIIGKRKALPSLLSAGSK